MSILRGLCSAGVIGFAIVGAFSLGPAFVIALAIMWAIGTSQPK